MTIKLVYLTLCHNASRNIFDEYNKECNASIEFKRVDDWMKYVYIYINIYIIGFLKLCIFLNIVHEKGIKIGLIRMNFIIYV